MKTTFPSECAVVRCRTAVGFVLCLAGVFLAFAGLGQNAKNSARQIDAANPCDPERKFCGRIHIEIESAGSISATHSYTKGAKGVDADLAASISPTHPYTKGAKGVDADLTDVASNFVYSNFHQFRRNDESGLPSYSIVLSSDPKLQQKLNGLPSKIREEAGFLGVVPASIDSVNELLDNDEISLVDRAIRNFQQQPECRELMKKTNISDVRPLLKTELVVIGENDGGYIPLWSNKKEYDGIEAYLHKNNPPRLDLNLIAKLRAKLGDSVVQTFVDACDGPFIAEKFESLGNCSCYLSSTADDVFRFPESLGSPTFASMFKDGGRSIRALRTKSPGADNVFNMVYAMSVNFGKYEGQGNAVDGHDSLYAGGNRSNPLMSFLATSADSKVNKILKDLVEENIDKNNAEKLLAAGFNSELPALLRDEDQNFSNETKSILATTKYLKNLLLRSTNETTANPVRINFEEKMRTFRTCAAMKIAKPEYCRAIQELVHRAGRSDPQSVDERNLIDSANDFYHEFDKYDATSPEDSSMLVKKFESNQITLSEFSSKLNKVWQKFEVYRQNIMSYAVEVYNQRGHEAGGKGYIYAPVGTGETGVYIPGDVDRAFTFMTVNIREAMQDVQRRYFPLLRKEALEVKLTRIEDSAKLLEKHKTEIRKIDPSAALRDLRNSLECLTFYPVGPAFDTKYGKELHANSAPVATPSNEQY